MKDAGIPIDFVGGTSVGAAMAAGLAAGLHPDEILDRTEETFLRNRAMRRITVPIYSILDHRAFDKALQRHYGDRRMEDLPLNSFAVSANLTNRRMHLHRGGLLWEAVRASTSIPGILPPFITKDGDVLVDGALVDNVPVNVMRDLKLGPNVVVLFQQAGDWRVTRGYAELPSRGALLRHLLLRRRSMDYPTLVSIIMRGMFPDHENIQRMSKPATVSSRRTCRWMSSCSTGAAPRDRRRRPISRFRSCSRQKPLGLDAGGRGRCRGMAFRLSTGSRHVNYQEQQNTWPPDTHERQTANNRYRALAAGERDAASSPSPVLSRLAVLESTRGCLVSSYSKSGHPARPRRGRRRRTPISSPA